MIIFIAIVLTSIANFFIGRFFTKDRPGLVAALISFSVLSALVYPFVLAVVVDVNVTSVPSNVSFGFITGLFLALACPVPIGFGLLGRVLR